VHRAVAARFGERDAVVHGSIRRTWAEVAGRTDRLAGMLLAHGVGGDVKLSDAPWASTQDHLGIFLLNGPEYLETVVAAHKARVAPFNINYRYVEHELDYLLADASPAALVFHARFAAPVASAVARLARPVLLIQVADDSRAPLVPGAIDFEAGLAAAAPVDASVVPAATDLHILYTGGTTGMPKGVLWPVGDLLAGPMGLRHKDGTPLRHVDEVTQLAERRPRRVLPTPPLMHGAGMWFALGAWCTGGTVVIQDHVDRFDPKDVVDTWENERVEESMLVGDAFARPLISELRSRTSLELPALRLLVNSGAALRPELKDELRGLLPDVRLVDMLGSSETGPQASRQGTETTFQRRPGLHVVSEDFTRRLEPGDPEVGWLAQTGSIPLGYLGDPTKTDATFRTIDGVRHSVPGDRVRFEADSTFTLFGRDSTTINTGGEKVYAEEVEGVIRNLPSVVDALVVGVESDRWGQEVVAVVQLDTDTSDDVLLAGAAKRLARYKLPKRFVRVEAVRRQPNGKADYTWARSAAD
jgi:acyl-CoA synthetase (AMP-forming)/AMP-acid ligase II